MFEKGRGIGFERASSPLRNLIHQQDAVDMKPGNGNVKPIFIPFPPEFYPFWHPHDVPGLSFDLKAHPDGPDRRNRVDEIVAVGDGETAPVKKVESETVVGRSAEGDIDRRRRLDSDHRMGKKFLYQVADKQTE